jgi:flagellar basal body-associated protein FliL
MAKAVTNKEPPKKRRWLGTIIGCVAAVMLLAVGATAAWLYARMTAPADEHALSIVIYRFPHETETQPNQSANELPMYQTRYYEFEEPFTTNLLNSMHITQVKVALSTTYEEAVLDGVRTHSLAVRSAILAVLSSAGEADLRSQAGKHKIQDAIKDSVNAVLASKTRFPGIEAAHITSLVIQ